MSGISSNFQIPTSQQIAWNQLWQKLLSDPSGNESCCDTVPIQKETQLKLVKSEKKPDEI